MDNIERILMRIALTFISLVVIAAIVSLAIGILIFLFLGLLRLYGYTGEFIPPQTIGIWMLRISIPIAFIGSFPLGKVMAEDMTDF